MEALAALWRCALEAIRRLPLALMRTEVALALAAFAVVLVAVYYLWPLF